MNRRVPRSGRSGQGWARSDGRRSSRSAASTSASRAPRSRTLTSAIGWSAAGHRLRLDTAIRGTHLRGWSLTSSIATDVRDRGVPWTQALIKYGSVARDRQLNISWRGRTSVVLSWLVWASLSIAPAWPPALGIALGAMTGFVWSEWPLLARFVQLRGRLFAVGVLAGNFCITC